MSASTRGVRIVDSRTVVALALAWSAASPAAAQAPAAQQTPPGDLERGARLYVDRACWQCHGLAAQGGGIAGPRLAGRVLAWAAFSQYVRRPVEEMIPYTANVLPEQELADIFAWLKDLPPPPPVDSLPLLAPAR
jgi:ubiquinol-cytochrome c reductase cytochrome c subunit